MRVFSFVKRGGASLRVMSVSRVIGRMHSVPESRFGSTDLVVSRIGFGAWAIGGPAMAGSTPIGWGDTDDATSTRAIEEALDRGITFFDTADFYGLGHSEELIGRVLGNRADVQIATKVGHRLADDESIVLDYSRDHILRACEASLRRLRRDQIDLYQLHSARISHLEQGECIEAMERLVDEGKVRYWGLSLNTYRPEPEATYLMDRRLGHGFQLVLNVINQRSLDIVRRAAELGYGMIARMPLQFGLLAGKFDADTRFGREDHRSFRLTPTVLRRANDDLAPFRNLANSLGVLPASLALAYVLSYRQVSSVIPGIRTPEQASLNAAGPFSLKDEDRLLLEEVYDRSLAGLVDLMQDEEST